MRPILQYIKRVVANPYGPGPGETFTAMAALGIFLLFSGAIVWVVMTNAESIW